MWAWVLLLLLSVSGFAQTPPGPSFEIQTEALPPAIIETPYSTTLVATGGTVPMHWRVEQGKLPPGFTLVEETGVISGTLSRPGVYKFKVVVVDSTGQTATRDFQIEVLDVLVVNWASPPILESNKLSGSVEVTNYSKETFDLTVIIVSVNEVGKAFTLGYKKVSMAQSAHTVVPFSTSLPNGRYFARVDAVAEVPARNQIHRANLQTEPAIVVSVNR